MLFKRKAEVVTLKVQELYPMGSLTFAIACSHCKNIGTELCWPCKSERKSGFEAISLDGGKNDAAD